MVRSLCPQYLSTPLILIVSEELPVPVTEPPRKITTELLTSIQSLPPERFKVPYTLMYIKSLLRFSTSSITTVLPAGITTVSPSVGTRFKFQVVLFFQLPETAVITGFAYVKLTVKITKTIE